MQERIALVEPLLNLGILMRDRKVRLADRGHFPRAFARTLVEFLAMTRVALFDLGGR
jgi:hypothetical protein